MPKLLAVLASGVLWGMVGCGGGGTPVLVESSRLSGNWHGSCAIDEVGALWCWGAFGGPSGDARSAPTGTPVRIGTDRWREVAVATSHACAIRDDGSLWCWGHNCAGQLGDGTRDDRAEPTRLGAGTSWRRVAVGGGHSCAIDEGGGLYCWGGADYGQQICDPTPPEPPTRIDGIWTAVSSHYYSTHALRIDGTLWRWQDFSYGNLSSPFAHAEALGRARWRAIASGVGYVCGVRVDGRLACVDDEHFEETVIGTDDDWSDTLAASYHTCAIKLDGTLWCWGPNSDGEIGTGAKSVYVAAPTQVGTQADWVGVSAGGASSCGRRAGGEVLCWGANESGELGIGDFPWRPAPAQVGSESGWSSPTIGFRFTCALQGGALRCWGSDAQGQLGLDAQADQLAPATVPGRWRQAAAASFSTCAIDDGRKLWCWGGAGLGGSADRCAVAGTQWATVAAGEGGTCVLDDGGQAACWPGGYTADQAPEPLAGFAWRSIASSYSHSCGVLLDGSLRCWGQNGHGELGSGDTDAYATPVEVAGGGQWLMVSTGNGGLAGVGGYSCAIRDDGARAGTGRLYCWGGGGYGRLGNGSDEGALAPTQVGVDHDWTSVSAGPVRACALKQNGELWCWGRNDDGGLGIGSADGEVHAPVRVGAERAWAQVTVRFHTCATAADGTLWCWGWGGAGELGDGTAWRVTPTPVALGVIP